jgi:transcriptional regulator GlxA family with amidase domain
MTPMPGIGSARSSLTDVRTEPLRLPEPSDRRLSVVTEWLHAHPHDSSSLSELGRRVGSSERTLSRLFRDELGMSFNQWRTLLRVQHALIYLEDDPFAVEFRGGLLKDHTLRQ